MSLTKRLEQVLDSAEMAYSEAYSARESLPDYSANESASTTMRASVLNTILLSDIFFIL